MGHSVRPRRQVAAYLSSASMPLLTDKELSDILIGVLNELRGTPFALLLVRTTSRKRLPLLHVG